MIHTFSDLYQTATFETPEVYTITVTENTCKFKLETESMDYINFDQFKITDDVHVTIYDGSDGASPILVKFVPKSCKFYVIYF